MEQVGWQEIDNELISLGQILHLRKADIILPEPVTLYTWAHSHLSGDYVYMKTWNPEPLQEKRKGPYQVLLTIKVEGIAPWIHYTGIKNMAPMEWKVDTMGPLWLQIIRQQVNK